MSARSRRRRSRKIRLVVQPSSGCGPACVAMVAHVSFEEAVIAIWGYARKRGFYCWYSDIKAGLVALGHEVPARAVRCTRFELISELSIVACKKRRDGGWHFVIWDPKAGRLLDPLKPKRVQASLNELNRRYRPFSRLPVRR